MKRTSELHKRDLAMLCRGETLVRSIKEKRDKNMSFEEYGQDFTRWVKLIKNDKK